MDAYKGLKKNRRAKELEAQKQSGNIITQKKAEEAIRSWGIKAGDTVMLHSSLGKIGFVDGGAGTIINAFLNVIENGNLMMPAFPAMGFNFDYLETKPVFDVKNTVSRMGMITETFRKMPGVKRSLHPTDSVVALGPYAEEIVKGHYGRLTPYDDHSPFYKLCAMHGKIVLLGVDFNSLTNLHTVEDAVSDFKFPVYHQKIFECEMIDENGRHSYVKTKVHNPQWSKKRKCNDLIEPFKQGGFLKEGKLGNALAYIIEAHAMHDWMLKNYREKGISMYTPRGI